MNKIKREELKLEAERQRHDGYYEDGYMDGKHDAKQEIIDMINNVDTIPTSPISRTLDELKNKIQREVDIRK